MLGLVKDLDTDERTQLTSLNEPYKASDRGIYEQCWE